MKPVKMMLAVGAAVLAAGAIHADATPGMQLQTLVDGTAHEALFAIAFDGNKGVAVGAPGAILTTEDAGATWKLVEPAPTPLTLLSAAIKGEHALAVGQEGLVLRRDGTQWKKVESGAPKKRLLSVSINSKGQAVIAGSFGTVLRSDDGGTTWTSIAPDWENFKGPQGMDPGVEPHMYSANIDESGVVTVSGEFGLILRSAGKGGDWKTLHGGEASIFAISFRDDGVGYAVGQNGTVLRSGDRGLTWTALATDSKAILLGVKSSPDGHILITGVRDMLASSDDGKSWSHVTGGDAATSWYEGIAQASATSPILAVGRSGKIIRIGG